MAHGGGGGAPPSGSERKWWWASVIAAVLSYLLSLVVYWGWGCANFFEAAYSSAHLLLLHMPLVDMRDPEMPRVPFAHRNHTGGDRMGTDRDVHRKAAFGQPNQAMVDCPEGGTHHRFRTGRRGRGTRQPAPARQRPGCSGRGWTVRLRRTHQHPALDTVVQSLKRWYSSGDTPSFRLGGAGAELVNQLRRDNDPAVVVEASDYRRLRHQGRGGRGQRAHRESG